MDFGKKFVQGTAFLLGFLLVGFVVLIFINFILKHNFKNTTPPPLASSTFSTNTDFPRTIDGCITSPSDLSKSVDSVFTDVRGGVVCHFLIHPQLSTYTFELIPNTAENRLERLIIKEYETDKIMQNLRIKMDSEPPSGINIVTAEDFNFDGYLDLKIINWWGATGNIGYTILLFNPTSDTFIEHTGLSNLSNPTIIPNSQTISSYSTGGMAGCIYTAQTYSITDNNKLVLQHEEKQDWDNKTQSVRKQTKTLVDGTYDTSLTTGQCGN
ncbi:MAG: hypothetical protein RLZZ230_945 [Candidatus Parcubacteria bacterium]|jgi:hypothetical protein